MASFATVADLQTATKKTYTGQDITWVTELLEQASAHLRTILGWQVYPPTAMTYRTRIRACEFYPLPVQPATLTSVVLTDGTVVVTDHFDGGFEPETGGTAVVTFTAGYAAAPPDLKSWTIVLASQVIDVVSKLGMLSSGGLSSVAIDDFKMVWSQTGENTAGYGVPETVAARLKESFGSSAYVTGG
jgi:hypothetical protein